LANHVVTRDPADMRDVPHGSFWIRMSSLSC